MTADRIIESNNKEDIWQQISNELMSKPLAYNATIVYNQQAIVLDIDDDPGGGFESGYQATTLLATLEKIPPFRFSIHESHISDDISKFFGMQDVQIGYQPFDERLIVKTDNKAAVRRLFASPTIRTMIESLHNFTFTLHREEHGDFSRAILELSVEEAIVDTARLRMLFDTFYAVLIRL